MRGATADAAALPPWRRGRSIGPGWLTRAVWSVGRLRGLAARSPVGWGLRLTAGRAVGRIISGTGRPCSTMCLRERRGSWLFWDNSQCGQITEVNAPSAPHESPGKFRGAPAGYAMTVT